jgi:hypothetical protein
MTEIADIRSSLVEMLAEGYEEETVVSVTLARADETSLRAMSEDWLRGATSVAARNLVRGVERTTFADRAAKRAERQAELLQLASEAFPVASAKLKLAEKFIDLYDQSFVFEKGQPGVTWGEANRDQHRSRIGMLSSQVQGLSTTIDQHAEVLDILDEFGIKCLNELRAGAR